MNNIICSADQIVVLWCRDACQMLLLANVIVFGVIVAVVVVVVGAFNSRH